MSPPPRPLILTWGLLTLLWLGPEGREVWLPALLGVSGALLAGWRWLAHAGAAAEAPPWLLNGLLGAVVGLAAALLAAGLMFFKSALHAHPIWDFPPPLIAAMLARAPAWMLAGALVGLGLALWPRRGRE